MASIAQRNAAFDSAKVEAHEMVRALTPQFVPWPMEEGAESKLQAALDNPANAKYILRIVDAVIKAVETTPA